MLRSSMARKQWKRVDSFIAVVSEVNKMVSRQIIGG
jgi:hypothetical protein